MSRRSQISGIIKQELRAASRSKYMVLGFLVMPILIWLMQGGFMMLTFSIVEQDFNYEGSMIYIVNLDDGNDTHNLGNMVYDRFGDLLQDNSSELHNAVLSQRIFDELTMDNITSLLRESDLSPLIVIPSNFTSSFAEYNSSVWQTTPIIDIYMLPNDEGLGFAVQRGLNQVTRNAPFNQVNIIKETLTQRIDVTYEGEEEVNSFTLGFVGLMLVMLSVMAPAAFISASFAGEREKHTLEALLALPVRRFDILFSKLMAGMGLVLIFAITNLIGMKTYEIMVTSIEVEGINFFSAISLQAYVMVTLMMLLSAFVSVGVGIAIASRTKDTRTSESVYMLSMLVPALLVGMISFTVGLPESINALYVLPWTHSLAILYKALYPQTYASTFITGSLIFDLLIHLGYLLLFVIGSLGIATWLFNREDIV